MSEIKTNNFWSVMDTVFFNKIVENTIIEASIMLDNENRLVATNKEFEQMFELDSDKATLGKNWIDIQPSGTEWRVFNNLIKETKLSGKSCVGIAYSATNKTWLIGKSYIKNKKLSLYIGHIKDTIENYKLLKNYDTLTMLPNREIHEEHFEKEKELGVFVLIDIKRFHLINENFGSKVGDKVLVELSERLQRFSAFKFPLYRVGGNQFLLVVPKDNEIEAIKEIQTIMAKALEIGDNKFYINCTLAVFEAGKEEDNKKALYYTEETLWHGKKSKKAISYYSKASNKSGDLAMEHDLRKAIENHPEQFIVEYQMQHSVKEHKFCGAEALVRWFHPEKGRINPNDFLGIAQEMQFLPQIDKIVFEKVIKEIDMFKEKGKDFVVSINLSAQSVLDEKFQAYLLNALDEKKPNISFELTETEWINPLVCQGFLEGLKSRGYAISIDDFGTGYASFEYIMNYPADFIKIDRKFVHGLEHNEKNQTIVSNIIKMSNGLKLQVVAEGAETESEVKILEKFGCDIIQGFYYARPHTLEKILAGAVNL